MDFLLLVLNEIENSGRNLFNWKPFFLVKKWELFCWFSGFDLNYDDELSEILVQRTFSMFFIFYIFCLLAYASFGCIVHGRQKYLSVR